MGGLVQDAPWGKSLCWREWIGERPPGIVELRTMGAEMIENMRQTSKRCPRPALPETMNMTTKGQTKTRKRNPRKTAASSRRRRSEARAPLPTAVIQPEASRPYMEGYGIPSDSKGMLRWADAAARLEKSRNYWIIT